MPQPQRSSGSDHKRSHIGPSWGTSWTRSKLRMLSRVSIDGDSPPCKQNISDSTFKSRPTMLTPIYRRYTSGTKHRQKHKTSKENTFCNVQRHTRVGSLVRTVTKWYKRRFKNERGQTSAVKGRKSKRSVNIFQTLALPYLYMRIYLNRNKKHGTIT